MDDLDLNDETEALIRMRTGPSIWDTPRTDPSKWTQTDAIALCVAVEAVCPRFGCHVALTGGMLYKQGQRKDCDILFYRIRQWADIDQNGLFAELRGMGFENIRGQGWCWKADYQGKKLDLFFPEQASGEYTPEELAERDQVRKEATLEKAIKADLDFDDIPF